MNYVQVFDRDQMMMTTWDSMVDPDSTARLIDQKLMEESGQSQMSFTDAKLMKSKNGFAVAYNPQTAVDSETHLIRGFAVESDASAGRSYLFHSPVHNYKEKGDESETFR